ncbi:MAG: redoxin domain-containing protein [Candidatus Micrarchaeota archaeon]
MTDQPVIKVRAPELEGIIAWLNSGPLTLESLKGKVVLIDFWTYTCINCRRTLPHLMDWHKRYAKDGLVIIGVHSPEFEFEKSVQNVKSAVKRLGIGYPVAVDSDMATWRRFDNHYWPAKYLIDRNGFISHAYFGEGNYNETEMMIQEALGKKTRITKEEPLSYLFDQSPEAYAGFSKNSGLGSGLVCDKSGCNVYIDPGDHTLNVIYPHGQWMQEREYLELKKGPGKISYKFNAREANVVLAPLGKPVNADVYVDGKKSKPIKIDHPDMYNVFKDGSYKDRELEVVFDQPVRLYAFTFG